MPSSALTTKGRSHTAPSSREPATLWETRKEVTAGDLEQVCDSLLGGREEMAGLEG